MEFRAFGRPSYLISEDEDLTTITKSRDLTLCHERIMKDVGLTYPEKCIECQQVRSKCLINAFVSRVSTGGS